MVSGRNLIEMADGRVIEVGAGDLFEIGPGHDSVVIGDEPYVSIHFLGADPVRDEVGFVAMADVELHTLLLCDYALTAQDGKISAIGVFSQINVARLPATHGRCFIVAILEATLARTS